MKKKRGEKMLYKPVRGYEDRYVVYENGTIVSIKRTIFCHGNYIETGKPKKLKPSTDKKGYLIVNLYDGNGNCKSKKVHRLVAEAFIPNPDGKRCVCHKDNNPANCMVDNLYWGTDQENQDQAWKDGLHHSEQPIRAILNDGIYLDFKSQNEAARVTGIPQANIWKCLTGERRTAGGFRWQRLG